MATQNNNTSDTPKAVQNEFNTFMALRTRGVDKDTAFRAADHVRRATNTGGDKGATAAVVQILLWLGAGILVLVLAIGLAQYANAAAPANRIHLPSVSQRCNPCTSSVPYPTPTATPFINKPPMPTAEARHE